MNDAEAHILEHVHELRRELNRVERKIDRLLQASLDGQQIAALTAELRQSSDALGTSLQGQQVAVSKSHVLGGSPMANPVLDALAAQVADNLNVESAAAEFIDGEATRIQTAVDAALANGATAAELAPVQAEVDAMKASRDKLAASIAANTATMATTAKKMK